MLESFMVAFNAVAPFLILLGIGFASVRLKLTDRDFMNRLKLLNSSATAFFAPCAVNMPSSLSTGSQSYGVFVSSSWSKAHHQQNPLRSCAQEENSDAFI